MMGFVSVVATVPAGRAVILLVSGTMVAAGAVSERSTRTVFASENKAVVIVVSEAAVASFVVSIGKLSIVVSSKGAVSPIVASTPPVV